MDRSQIAQVVEDQLSGLMTDAEWNVRPDGTKTEGDMTFCIDMAWRELGYALTEDVDEANINRMVSRVTYFMLTKLYNHFALLVDTTMGPKREFLSQIASNIARRIKNMSGTEAVLVSDVIEYDYPGTTFGAGGEMSLADVE